LADATRDASNVRQRRWRFALAFSLCVVALACIPPALWPAERATPVATWTPVIEATPSPTEVAPTVTPTAPVPTSTALPTLTPSPTATPTVVAARRTGALSPDDVQIFPWPLYEGDRLSVDVSPDLSTFVPGDQFDEASVTLTFEGMGPFTTSVSPHGLAGAPQARFYWFADVPEMLVNGSLAPDGSPTLVLTVTLTLPDVVLRTDMGETTVVLQVPVRSRDAMPPPEPAAQWAVTETVGVRLHYLTGSAAERDLALLLDESLAAYEAVTSWLGEAAELVDIYLLDRVIGQGGYASAQWVAISYADRAYAPIELGTVLRHELVHRLDGAIGCTRAPSLLREGLAVYLAEGHYRPEPLHPKAAALLDTPHYIPLDTLVVDFYVHQHEVAYLEAASVVGYIVEALGWESLVELCGATLEAEGDDATRWQIGLDALGIDDSRVLEERWWEWLQDAGENGYDPALLALELRLMDAMRDYQTSYDPVAHFLQGILFSPAEGARLGIVADFVRRPRDPVAIGFELVLSMAQEAVRRQDAAMLALLVEELETALTQGPGAADGEADAAIFVRDAAELAELALERDWEPSRLLLVSQLPRPSRVTDGWSRRYLVYALDRLAWPQQSILSARHVDGAWELQGIPGVP
jgi:hypothetical protein